MYYNKCTCTYTDSNLLLLQVLVVREEVEDYNDYPILNKPRERYLQAKQKTIMAIITNNETGAERISPIHVAVVIPMCSTMYINIHVHVWTLYHRNIPYCMYMYMYLVSLLSKLCYKELLVLF